MNLEEKQKLISRQTKRLIRFMSWFSSQPIVPVTNNENKYDNLVETLLPSLRATIHVAFLAKRIRQIRAIHTDEITGIVIHPNFTNTPRIEKRFD